MLERSDAVLDPEQWYGLDQIRICKAAYTFIANIQVPESRW